MSTILFLSSTHKGDAMLHTAKELGYRVLLLTEESQRHEAWPFAAIDEYHVTPDFRRYQDVINTVTYLARGQAIDAIIPLDEFEVELASMLREHLMLPTGMGISATRNFRDKLKMRTLAQAAGIRVPRFTRLANYDEVRAFFAAVPLPYIFKPRMDAGSMGIEKIHDVERVWRKLDELGDKQSYYLLEAFVPGDVFHVDSIVTKGKVLFHSAQQYGRPPLETYQGGGVFETRSLHPSSPEAQALEGINAAVIKALGLQHGVTHAEYIRAHHDGQFYFLEVAARVGGANISDLIEGATGVNLWREWMRVEDAVLRGVAYKLPKVREGYGAVLMTLSHQQHPDLSSFASPELWLTPEKPYHAGMVLASPSYERISELVAAYKPRLQHEFSASLPPMDAQRTGRTQ